MLAPRKRRRLPRNISERTDAEIAEKVFGKKAKIELDRILQASTPSSTPIDGIISEVSRCVK